ncbi:MAG: hypothetical protein JOZ90_06300 [Alphaproteobacteria bacterium]|nr:hypothetical protein [Alphaproteobacteria bacterium]MBV9370912.1 hypothetical protein [Alphaproteobacteria bacterium]MBV9900691.1 hypothetical protein [Alphaproteobacteria bacterium]
MVRPIVLAALIAGTLDILSAFMFAGMAAMGPSRVLAYVASGPFGDAALDGGPGWAAAGLAVHYAIMTCMAAAYLLAAARLPLLVRHPVPAGLAYGVLLWLVMYWMVKPLRWPDAPLPHTAWGIGNALFSHCLLVGLPIALVAAGHMRRRAAAA